ncbi:MAG: FAD-binding oxidoreductase [Gammaproteobacteria bacterium]|nr:FAD-binding oxidoreductase [Gammaproteobacteria bacterium]MCZ6798223.1 FAD-binding oxidoreductase [Gammaproteobacteria bacterium]MCZ6882974.1 FAD-binding oxidoreductase [Gammaproteobacteria bacterium]
MGVRCAGTAEFGGLLAPPNPRRSAMLATIGKQLLPNLNIKESSDWMGYRPSLPDHLPAIGPLPGHPNIIAAFGHGHTGLTAAPMTGRLVSSLITNTPIDVDRVPYRPERFSQP